MAINWTETKYNSTTGRTETVRTWTTHEGLVLSKPWRTVERVMSDIYADAEWTSVWNVEKGVAETVNLGYPGFELCCTWGDATVDATPAVAATHQAQQEAARLAHEEAERKQAEYRSREAELAAWNKPERGKVMQVVRGRKVAKGTIGKVFWLDDVRNPSRVGLALNSTKDEQGRYLNVAWVDATYLANMAPHPTLEG